MLLNLGTRCRVLSLDFPEAVHLCLRHIASLRASPFLYACSAQIWQNQTVQVRAISLRASAVQDDSVQSVSQIYMLMLTGIIVLR